MRKKQYIKELTTDAPYLKKGMPIGMDVKKAQEWINLWNWYKDDWHIEISRDGHFGPSTESAIRKFQEYNSLTVDGIVGNNTWKVLTEPMRKAYTRINTSGLSLKQLVVAYAQQHLDAKAREFSGNRGTWVRSYMGGNEGPQWAWCMGFVQMVLDQATYTIGKDLKEYMPICYSCDMVGRHGIDSGKLLRNKQVRDNIADVEAGDVFLVVKTQFDWVHTGIVVDVNPDGWITTIEGNTNQGGSREGVEVRKRKRDVKSSNIDIFKI
jgi:hypothetical protein